MHRWIIGLYAALVLVASLRLPAMFDEAYYWTWAQKFALSYHDHPPGVAYILGASTALFGDGLLGLRLPSWVAMLIIALSTAGSVYRLNLRADQRGELGALAMLSLLGAPMWIAYLPATPDPYQGAAVALSAYLLVRALEPEARPVWGGLCAFVLIASIGIKHSSALIAVGAFAGLASCAHGRAQLRRPLPWLGVAAGLLFLAPWLMAEMQQTGSTQFQLDRVLSGRRPRGMLAIPITAGSMIGTLGPITALVLIRCALVVRSPSHAFQGAAMRALGGGAGALLFGCVVAVWRGSGEANWPMPAMVFGLPAVVLYLQARPRLFRAGRLAALGCSAVMLVGLLHLIHPFLPIPARKDRTMRAAGFVKVAKRAQALAQKIGAKVLVTHRYQRASMLRYHLRDRLEVVETGTPGGRKSQYDRWPRTALCSGQRAVVVLQGDVVPEGMRRLEASVKVAQARGGRVRAHYFLIPVQAQKAMYDPRARCPKANAP